MFHWYVDLIENRLHRFGTVVADTEERAIKEAIKQFQIERARQNKIVVQPVKERQRQ
jgi:hypothetical protein